MRDLNHPNLIKMITWYDCADVRAFLMPIYQSDLDDYLMGRTVANLEAPQQGSWRDSRRSSWRDSRRSSWRDSRRGSPSRDTHYCFPTNSWLWIGIIGVLDGLRNFHGLGSGEGRAAHLDLKPKNILISQDGNLVLSDCGLSRVVAAGEPLTTLCHGGTASYAPPLPQSDSDPSSPLGMLNEKCDTWSMACIMMEVMLFLIYGRGSVERFRINRKTNTGGQINDSFWEFIPGGETFRLKLVVVEYLNRVQQLSVYAGDDPLTNLTLLLRKMFSISPDERLTIGECLTYLNEPPLSPVIAPLPDPDIGLGGIVDSLHINRSLAKQENELGFYDDANMPRKLQPISEL